MIKDISSIKIQGANFSPLTILPILRSSDGKYAKISLLYGRNGSGKSTIAKAFRKIKGEAVTTITTAVPLDADNQLISLSESECANIFVFDEDFVSSNVRIEENGLGSIVMLGEQVDLSLQIEQAERELEIAEGLVNSSNDTYKEYQDNTNQKAPQYYLVKIHGVLQQNEGWAGRDSKARGLRQNSRVTDDTYKRFVELYPEESRDELIVAFNDKMKELEAAKSGETTISLAVPTIPDAYKNNSVALANELIKKKIEKPELSEREKYLFSLVTAGKADELMTRIILLKDEETTFCPYCLRDLTPRLKNDLVLQIQRVLTDEVKDHQEKLKELKSMELVLDLDAFSILPSYQSCINLITTINDTFNENNALLQRKIENPYLPIIDEELSETDGVIKSLDQTLKRLEEERENHNSKTVKTQPIVDELVSINDQIAYYDVIEYSEQLSKQRTEMIAAKKKYDDAVAERDSKKKKLEELNRRRESIDIAVEIINNGLKYIFFAEDRLTIEPDGEYYKLLVNGHAVPPKDVSVGERNIIGLCYFFTSIMTGKNKDTVYNEEHLIIIDDPVSSYDFENKVGILSFLKYKLSQFLEGNESSRTIIMTHDLLTFFDLEKVCQEFVSSWKRTLPGEVKEYNLLELKNCDLKRFEYKKRQEYTELIKQIYEYGCGNAGEYDVVIGNIMRQALEAFATFEYRKGIESVSTDETLLSGLCDEHKSYFKNLMYRIVLNNGSHRKEQTQSMKLDIYQ